MEKTDGFVRMTECSLCAPSKISEISIPYLSACERDKALIGFGCCSVLLQTQVWLVGEERHSFLTWTRVSVACRRRAIAQLALAGPVDDGLVVWRPEQSDHGHGTGGYLGRHSTRTTRGEGREG